MSDERLIRVGRTTAFLPEDGALRRLPRAPHKQRPATFHERFEDRALVYDCFWHADGERILFVGPPPMNLRPHYRGASYTALPSGTPLTARYHPSLSTMITELSGAPAGTTAVRFAIADQVFELPVGANLAADFGGRRILFTMSKDNELGWIAEWARWHARLHGTDAIVLFDNGSARYSVEEIEETLLGVPGIARVAVPSWPGRYGETDHAVLKDPFYVLFLQVSSMSVALRRFADGSAGLLNCDIDELIETPPDTDIYTLGASSRQGLVVMRGWFVEANPVDGAPDANRVHRHFRMHHLDPARAISPQKKWVLDPSRAWVRDLRVHPYMHWIHRRPMFGKSSPRGVRYHHFRAINTNWKELRARPADPSALRLDTYLEGAFAGIESA